MPRCGRLWRGRRESRFASGQLPHSHGVPHSSSLLQRRPLTPALANSYGWYLTWAAVKGNYDIVTKYYTFNGQTIAMRRDGVLTYLHADHLDRTVLTTDAEGNPTVGQGYYAYGPGACRARSGGVLPTATCLPLPYTSVAYTACDALAIGSMALELDSGQCVAP